MHSKNIPLFFIVASLTSTSLGLRSPSLAITARRSFNLIMARQADPPTQCTRFCNDLFSSIEDCRSTEVTTCLCNGGIFKGVQNCINCSLQLAGSNATLISEIKEHAQSLIEGISGDCLKVTGIPNPIATIPALTVITNAGAPESKPTVTASGDTTAAALPSTTSPTSTPSPNTGTALGSLSTGPGSLSANTGTASASSLGSLSNTGPGSLSTSTPSTTSV